MIEVGDRVTYKNDYEITTKIILSINDLDLFLDKIKDKTILKLRVMVLRLKIIIVGKH